MASKIIRLSLNCLSRNFPPDKLNQVACINKWAPRYNSTSQTCQVQDVTEREPESTLLLSKEDKEDFFRLKNLFTIEDLFNARAHFGHKEGLMNGYMRPYIYGRRLGVLIIDLNHTARLLHQALNVIAETSYRDGIVMFFTSSRQNSHLVEKAAKDCGEYAFCRKWNHHVFTNSQKLFGSVTRLPDLVIMLNVAQGIDKNHDLVTHSARMLIPTVGICDTNCDPTLVTYPVPGNDDSPQSIELYAELFKTAVIKGKSKKNEIIEKYGEEFYYKTIE